MSNYELLSLDIWDTILRRNCHPDAIKKSTMRFLLYKYFNKIKEEYRNIDFLLQERIKSEIALGSIEVGKGFDDEYSIKEVFSLLLSIVIIDYDMILISTYKDIVADLYDFEFCQEMKCTYLDPGIVDYVSNINFKKLCYISDFYADEDFLEKIIYAKGFHFKFTSGYSSCNLKYNKRSGRLFDVVMNNENVASEFWLHIGDNEYSDVTVPSKKGINTYHYLPAEENKKRKHQKNIYESPSTFEIEAMNAALTAQFDNSIERLGATYSIFFFSYVMWIIEKCIEHSIRDVYYFTREGEFFKDIHDIIIANNPYGVELPKPHILEVSRKSTFCASLREVTLDELMRLWNQYSIQSPKAFLNSLDISETELGYCFTKYGISLEDDIVYPWLDERIIRLFDDSEFLDTIENIINEKKKLADCYYTKMGIKKDGLYAFVDIGWRGTIQDNICIQYPNCQIYGFYIGLIPFLNTQPTNAKKFGFINESPLLNEILKSCTPFEMICNSPNGSTMRYTEINNEVVAVRAIDECENNVYTKFTKHFQKGVLSAIVNLCNFTNEQGSTANSYYNLAINTMHKFITAPEKEIADIYFQLRHNEEFGVGKYIDKRTRFRPLLFISAIFSNRKRQELKEFLNGTSWPQGYLVKYRLYPLIKIYNMVLKRYVKK